MSSANEMKYRVVINHEEQYSIWPDSRTVPEGWRDTGKEGTKEECLDHIETVWTDMRPRSVREFAEQGRRAGESGTTE